MCKHNLFAFPYSFIWDSTNIWTTIQSLCDTRRSCILPIFVIICEEIIILHIFILISGDPVSLSNFIKIAKTVRVKDVTYYKSKGLPILFLRFSDSGMVPSPSLFTSVSKVTLSRTSSFSFYWALPTAWPPVVLWNASFLYLLGHENTSSLLHTSVIWGFKLYSMEFRIIFGFYYNHIYKNHRFFLKMWISHLNVYECKCSS